MSSESYYQTALKTEMIRKLRQYVREWREGTMGAEDAMYELEGYVDEIWGSE